ncbi:MAG: hypothetical protein CMJ83_07100 [Planctomycetes bacterium]|nr:hypothetical protein [Planctomycetota bacterium]
MRGRVTIAILLVLVGVALWLILANRESVEVGRAIGNPGVSIDADPAPGDGREPASAMRTDRYAEPQLSEEHASAGHDPRLHGAILVRVTWQETTDPAVGVGVLGYGFVDGHQVWLERMTGVQGQVLLEGLRPGGYAVQLDRPGVSSSVQVEAGKQSPVDLQIPPGPDVEGIVVDAQGRPVTGADIVLSLAGIARKPLFVAGQSGSDGKFHLRDLHAFNLVGARTRAHGTSDLHLLIPLVTGGKELVKLRIELPAGAGSLTGVVRDVAGEPLAAVAIAIGREDIAGRRSADGGVRHAPPPQRTLTDRDGNFAVEGIAAGDHAVLAERDGFAPHTGPVAISAGRPTTLEIRLQAAATLEGRVTDSSGEALAKVGVEVVLPPPLRSPDATTADDGTFRIGNLPPGEFLARARHHPQGEASTRVTLIAGRVTRWDTALVAGLSIRGVVVDHRGDALSGWWVGVGGHPKGYKTDAEGLFEAGPFTVPRARRLRVSSTWGFRPAELVVEAVHPGPERIRIQVPETARASAFIIGTVVGPDGREIPATNLDLEQSGDPISDTPRPSQDGAFRIGPLPPGRYTLSLRSSDLPAIRVPSINLSAGEEHDLGVLRFEAAGRLDVRLEAPSDLVLRSAVLRVHDKSGRELQRGVLVGARASFGPLPARRLRLCVRGDGIAARMIPFEIVAAATTSLRVVLSKAPSVTIHFPETARSAVAGGLRVTITDHGGESAFDGRLRRGRDGNLFVRLSLSAGSYRVVAMADNGLSGSASLAVASEIPNHLSVPLR